MNSLPQIIIEQIVAELPYRTLKYFEEESPWSPLVEWAVHNRMRYRVVVFLPPGERTSIFYKLEKEDPAKKTWTHFPLQDFLSFPERLLLESVSIEGQPYIRPFKRKNFYCVEPTTDGKLPTSLELLLSRPFAKDMHTTLRLSTMSSSYRHLPHITRLIRHEFQNFKVEDVFGHPLAIDALLSGSVNSVMLRKIVVTSADCGDNICKLIHGAICQPQFRHVQISSGNVDFDVDFFRALYQYWENLREFQGKVYIMLPSSISESSEIKPKGRRKGKPLRTSAHFNIFFTSTHRYGFRQQIVQINYS